MSLGRINSKFDLAHQEENTKLLKDKTTTKQTLFYTHNFDTRVKFFNSVLQSSLFKNSNISKQDLQFWFPECLKQTNSKKTKYVNKKEISESIECFLAEIMEDEIG